MDVAVDLRVAEMLCSRLCHDLVSPTGAIKSGLELIAEFGDAPDDEAMRLIRNSAEQAAARLQVFRVAFGFTGSAQASVGLSDAASHVASLIGGRTQLSWPAEQQPEQPRPQASGLKLLLNMVLLGAEALPRGGSLRVEVAPGEGHLACRVIADADDARLSEQLLAAFRGETMVDDLTPRLVQGYYAGLVGRRLGNPVALEQGPPLVLTATLPALTTG